jgi:putative ABC transport system substrate-binding protein
MNRRAFVVTSVSLLARPLVIAAQPAGKVYRISSIAAELPATPSGQGLFWDRMRELGWSYGKNVVIEHRMFGGDSERIPSLAQELMALGTDVFIVPNGTVVTRVQRVTRATPIVTTAAGDLVAAGFAANLARPGGNVTGVQVMQTEIGGKHLSLLKEMIPSLRRVGVLAAEHGFTEEKLQLTTHSTVAWIRALQADALTMRVELDVAIVSNEGEFEKAFAAFKSHRAQALILYGSSLMSTSRKTVSGFALMNRLPTICLDGTFVSAGDYLMSYGWDRQANLRLVADTVDKILRGTKAGDIPIQQPTTFRLVINLAVAKTLGLTVPRSILRQADEVVQ